MIGDNGTCSSASVEGNTLAIQILKGGTTIYLAHSLLCTEVLVTALPIHLMAVFPKDSQGLGQSSSTWWPVDYNSHQLLLPVCWLGLVRVLVPNM